MASNIAATRLRKELTKLKKDPPPGVIAEPKESDILTWFYALQGPPDTPYEGGIYVGKLRFPSEYPMKPPSILMLTPSGRFQVNTRLCMSMRCVWLILELVLFRGNQKMNYLLIS
jgi:ubiquitin-conjugating enzyme E2 J2